jgi:TetR/AcrR family transcriptional repressor of nem operon
MSTRDKILELAEDFIRTKGYNGFSYSDISQALAVKNAAVHYYFPTKESLGASVLEKEIQGFLAHEVHWKRLNPEEKVRKLFEMFAGYGRIGLSCLMGSLCSAYETLPSQVRMNTKALGQRILAWLTPVLEEGRKQRYFHFEGDARDRALILLCSLMSSLLLARVQGFATLERIHKQILQDLIA